MTKEKIIEKLNELGIQTENVYPKKSFIKDGIPVVGVYERELKTDFYFHNQFDNRIYKTPKTDPANFDKDEYTTKFLIPLSNCEIIWEDKAYQEIPDIAFSNMTLRHYACIHLKVPESGLPWLDVLIKKSKE